MVLARGFLGVFLALGMTCWAAIEHGRYSWRWGNPTELEQVAAALDSFPVEIGPWRSVADGDPLSESVMQELGVRSYLTRVYVHRQTGESVSVLLMVGMPGRLVRHPPTICYRNRANRQIGEVQTVRVDQDESASEFFCVRYERSNTAARERFGVFFAHSDNGVWEASDSPRMRFGGAPFLAKVQVVSVENDGQPAPVEEFVQPGSFGSEFSEAFRAFIGSVLADQAA